MWPTIYERFFAKARLVRKCCQDSKRCGQLCGTQIRTGSPRLSAPPAQYLPCWKTRDCTGNGSNSIFSRRFHILSSSRTSLENFIMQFARRPWRRALAAVFAFSALLLQSAAAAERPRLRVDDYLIHANLDPKTHRMAAVAKIKFTALDDIASAVFELHNGLRVKEVTDAKGGKLAVERNSSDSTVRVNLPATLSKDQNATLTFNYEGVLSSADDSPVEGLKLANI